VKLWLKILLIALIFVIVVAGVAAVKVFGLRTFIGPRRRILTARRFERTSVRLERGRYLFNSMGCTYCHAPHDWTKPDAPMIQGMLGAGSVLPFTDFPGRVAAPNITPDPETGAGTWTDDMFARAIREGIGHDDRTLFPIMPYQKMADEDLASIVVYLRSLPAVRNSPPRTEIIFPVKYFIRNAPQPITQPIAQPDASNQVERGRYLVRNIGCVDCHTPVDAHHDPIPGMDFSGGQVMPGPWGKVASANLTPDPSGIPYYDEALFIRTIRTGFVGSRELSQVMPWWIFRNLTDQDLAAIFAYLKTLRPVSHRVDNSLPPTLCPLDGTMHGGGEQNRKQ
jgi:hypothetical protein